jgi:lambda repressor-like predicted transcriptional regulator
VDYIDIKYALEKNGYTLSRVGRELGLCGAQAISPVLHRKYISARVETRVSEITGIPLAKLFPDRYGRTAKRAPKDAGLKESA